MRCFWINSIFRGFATIVWPLIARILYDATFSYDNPFTVAGVFLILSVMCSYLIAVVQKYCDSYNAQSKIPWNRKFFRRNYIICQCLDYIIYQHYCYQYYQYYDTKCSCDIPFNVAGEFLCWSVICSTWYQLFKYVVQKHSIKKSPETRNFLEKNIQFVNV